MGDVVLSAHYRGKDSDLIGYCWWSHRDFKATLYVDRILFFARMYAMNAHDAWCLFYSQFWRAYIHEVIGHGLGHKFKVKGYSSKKENHLGWDDAVNAEMLRAWIEREKENRSLGAYGSNGSIFMDVYTWLEEYYAKYGSPLPAEFFDLKLGELE